MNFIKTKKFPDLPGLRDMFEREVLNYLVIRISQKITQFNQPKYLFFSRTGPNYYHPEMRKCPGIKVEVKRSKDTPLCKQDT